MYNYLEGFVIMSQKSCNFALRKSLRRPRACFADTRFSYRAIHCTQEIAKATVSLLCRHSLFLSCDTLHSEIRDVHHTDV